MIRVAGADRRHTHSDHFLDSTDKAQRAVLHGLCRRLHRLRRRGRFRYAETSGPNSPITTAQGIGTNVVSYVGFGAIRKAVIGDAARAPTPEELAKGKGTRRQRYVRRRDRFLGRPILCPQSFAKTDEVISLAKTSRDAPGAFMTPSARRIFLSIGLIASTKRCCKSAARPAFPAFLPY